MNPLLLDIGHQTAPGLGHRQNEDALVVGLPPEGAAALGTLLSVADGAGPAEVAVALARTAIAAAGRVYFAEPGLGVEASLRRAVETAGSPGDISAIVARVLEDPG